MSYIFTLWSGRAELGQHVYYQAKIVWESITPSDLDQANSCVQRFSYPFWLGMYFDRRSAVCRYSVSLLCGLVSSQYIQSIPICPCCNIHVQRLKNPTSCYLRHQDCCSMALLKLAELNAKTTFLQVPVNHS